MPLLNRFRFLIFAFNLAVRPGNSKSFIKHSDKASMEIEVLMLNENFPKQSLEKTLARNMKSSDAGYAGV